MKTIIAALLAVFVLWASLFITVLSQSARTNQLLRNDNKLLNQDTVILNTEKTTQADLENKINSLQSHVDCLFNLATQGNSAFISNASTCTISSSGGATGNTKSGLNASPNHNSGSTPGASAPAQSSPSPAPASKKPGLIKQITNFLGL